MKTLIALLTICATLTVTAQEQPVGKLSDRAISFVQGASTARSLTFTVYPSYAPELISNGEKDMFGVGVAALYPLGDYAYTGIRLDYLGSQFFAPSVTAGVKADVQVFGLNFTPMAYTGIVVPLAGARGENNEVGFIAGGGVKTTLWKGKIMGADASVSLLAAVEKWTNFEGEVFHIAPMLTIAW